MKQLKEVYHDRYGYGYLVNDQRNESHSYITVKFENVQVTFFDNEINDLKIEGESTWNEIKFITEIT